MDFGISPEVIKKLLYISVVLLSAVIVNTILKTFVKVPKGLQGRRRMTFASVLRNIISVVVYVIALNIILGILSVDIAPLLASAGIVGLIIGMGTRPFVEDLIGGMTILSQESIAIGDEVEIDGSVGKLERLGLRTLHIRAEDGALHIIPNGTVKKIINHSKNHKVGSKKAPKNR
jgi:moderate conductance mechanosensitive channel